MQKYRKRITEAFEDDDEVKAEYQDLNDVLHTIEMEDWVRARTISPDRVEFMLKSIPNPRQYIARALAIFYYFTFVKPVVRTLGRYTIENFLNETLSDYLDAELINKLSRVPVQKIREICNDHITANELDKVISNNYKNFGQWFSHSAEWVTESLLFNEDDSDYERLSYDALDKYDTELNKLFEDNSLYVDNCYFEDNGDFLSLVVTIDGDWKHDHLFADMLIRKFAENNGFAIVDVDNEVEAGSDSDNYRATHYYKFEMPERDDIKDTLEETYSQEELDQILLS